MSNIDSGTMIILAYPEASCTMTPSWYRPILSQMGVLKNNKICAGHSAILLISKKTGELFYTDFGRYITANGYGRTRTKYTDPELNFDVLAQFNQSGELLNFEEILKTIASHPEKTHGTGIMYASVHNNINIKTALQTATQFVDSGSISYAPFSNGASNCSRYVGSVIQAGLSTKQEKLKFKLKSIPVSSPLSNVFYGKSITDLIYTVNNDNLNTVTQYNWFDTLKYFFNSEAINNSNEKIIIQPDENFQWLSGLGSGSWFGLFAQDIKEQLFRIQRIENNGMISFDHVFKVQDKRFNLMSPYQFIFDCNALLCTVVQDGYKVRFNNIQ